jgi:hypothetical protein
MSYEVLWAAVQSNQYSYNKNFSKNQINDYISAILGRGAPEFCWMIDYVCQKKTLFECENSFTFNVSANTRPMNDSFRPTATDGFNIEPIYQGNGNLHVKLERAMLYWLQNSSMAFFTFFRRTFRDNLRLFRFTLKK